MTELMKRYEAQYGNSPWEEVLTDDFNLFVYDEFQRLERENTKLKVRVAELEEQLYERFDEQADIEAGK